MHFSNESLCLSRSLLLSLVKKRRVEVIHKALEEKKTSRDIRKLSNAVVDHHSKFLSQLN
jgi:hypothetical protein